MSEFMDFSDIDSLAAQLDGAPKEGESIEMIKVGLLQPGKYQPRRHISQEGLEGLAESISEQGIIQPIIVRVFNDTRFEIIAGERRWRAAQIAQLEAVPCIVRELDDTQARAIALIENIDREDMDLLDEVVAISALAEDIGTAEAARILGKRDKNTKKGFVSKCLKISKSPDFVLDFIQSGYSSDVDAIYNLALLAEESKENALALVQRWDEDPSLRTGLRKQVEIERKGKKSILKGVNDDFSEDEKNELLQDVDVEKGVSHAKRGPKKAVDSGESGVSDEDLPIVLKSASLNETGLLILHTTEGNFTFELDNNAKKSLRKAIDS